ncbi:hypothetical protein SAGO17_0048 [Mimivirus AB-566-O17]|uniref:Apple domain-containing protein n=1 Tax=Mimivirus AB-566-O17 TaxID=1988039 RepID=A0A1X9VNS2_9VIRU|nr:hypothetical protein SAGO17_0048 [Mimivirus AB-566-O17]
MPKNVQLSEFYVYTNKGPTIGENETLSNAVNVNYNHDFNRDVMNGIPNSAINCTDKCLSQEDCGGFYKDNTDDTCYFIKKNIINGVKLSESNGTMYTKKSNTDQIKKDYIATPVCVIL